LRHSFLGDDSTDLDTFDASSLIDTTPITDDLGPLGRAIFVASYAGGVFAIDQETGHLSLVQHIPTQGKTPRNFAFDPTSRWIICTNHDSNNAVVFRVDETTGRLTQVGEPVAVPYPFCERFLPVR
jgi:DNA-binding beta-propeller fold protein YncE